MAPEPKQLAGKDINEALLSDNTDDDDFAAGIEDDDAPNNESASADTEDEEDIPPETPETDDDPDDGPVTLRSLLAERNYELPEDADETEVFGNILDRYSQTDQAYRQLQEENRQYQQQLSWFMQQQGQPQQPQQAQQQSEQEAVENALTKLVAQRPEWKDSYLKFLERDNETGRLRVTDGADPTILQKYNQFVEWEREFDSAFKQDPNSFIFNAIQSSPQFQTYFQQQIQEAVGQVQDRMEAHQIAQQIRPYLEDPQGNPNAAGQAYMAAIEHAEQQLGIKGAKQLHTLGLQAAKPYIQYAMAQAQQTPQQKPPEKETPSASRKRRQLEFQKNGAAKRSNKNRRKEPKEELRDEDDMNRYAMALLQEEGIDPHARVE